MSQASSSSSDTEQYKLMSEGSLTYLEGQLGSDAALVTQCLKSESIDHGDLIQPQQHPAAYPPHFHEPLTSSTHDELSSALPQHATSVSRSTYASSPSIAGSCMHTFPTTLADRQPMISSAAPSPHSMVSSPHSVTSPYGAMMSPAAMSPMMHQSSPPVFYKSEPANQYYSPSPNHQQPLLLQRQNSDGVFGGEFDFTVDIPSKDKVTKSMAWIFSRELNRLYVQMGVQCPIRFKVTNVVSGLIIRASPIFTDYQYRSDIVHACHVHSEQRRQDIPSSPTSSFSSWMRVHSSQGSDILLDQEGHYSITTPWYITDTQLETVYSFSCRNTCVGGPNRRATTVVFTLENSLGQVLGKQVIEVKCNASPGRDAAKDEKKNRREQHSLATLAVSIPETEVRLKQMIESPKQSKPERAIPRKRHVHFSDEETPKKFYLEMSHQYTYDTLAPLRDALELSQSLPAERIKEFKKEQRLKSALKTRCSNTEPTPTKPTSSLTRAECSPRTHQQPDSTELEVPPHIDGDMAITEWLKSFEFEAYADTFADAGFYRMGQIINFGLQDIEALRIAVSQCRIILDHLNIFLTTDILSQPGSGEALGLIHIQKGRNLDLTCSSSED